MLLVASLALLAISPTVSGEEREDPWQKWQRSCRDMTFKDFDDFVKEARGWEAKLVPAHSGITRLANETCDAFLGQNQVNNADQIRGYSAERDLVTLTSLTLEQEGRDSAKYLEENFLDVERFARRLGITFKDYGCGKGFLERRAFVADQVKQLRERTQAAHTRCLKVMALAQTATPSGDKKEKLGASAHKPASSAPAAPAQKAKPGSSTISGEIKPEVIEDR